MRKAGVLKLMITIVARIWKNHDTSIRSVDGMFVSITSISLENLLMILPSGVVSKKDIGARRMLVNILL